VSSDLFPFTSHTFNNHNALQRFGTPHNTLVNTNYNTVWDANTLFFKQGAKQGYQVWTIPSDGTYRITAEGGGGGWDINYQHTGQGAKIRADITFTKGTKITIIVGMMGSRHGTTADIGAGGGGATWVLKENFTTSNNDVYMIAGGGGGAPSTTSDSGGSNTYSGGNADGSSQGLLGGGGATGFAGYAGGGAGWTGNGGGTHQYYQSGSAYQAYPNTGGRSPHDTDGCIGGNYGYRWPSDEAVWANVGGFGGGGGNRTSGAGGGAGATGGGAQTVRRIASSGSGVAEGGTSYIMPNGTSGVTVANRSFLGNHSSTHGQCIVQAPGTF
jgi:hypothetical protein